MQRGESQEVQATLEEQAAEDPGTRLRKSKKPENSLTPQPEAEEVAASRKGHILPSILRGQTSSTPS